MGKWIAAAVSAAAATLAILAANVGVHIWNPLVSAGVFTPPACPDGGTVDGVGVVNPMCVRPGSLVVVSVASVVASAVVAGFAAFRLADR